MREGGWWEGAREDGGEWEVGVKRHARYACHPCSWPSPRPLALMLPMLHSNAMLAPIPHGVHQYGTVPVLCVGVRTRIDEQSYSFLTSLRRRDYQVHIDIVRWISGK